MAEEQGSVSLASTCTCTHMGGGAHTHTNKLNFKEHHESYSCTSLDSSCHVVPQDICALEVYEVCKTNPWRRSHLISFTFCLPPTDKEIMKSGDLHVFWKPKTWGSPLCPQPPKDTIYVQDKLSPQEFKSPANESRASEWLPASISSVLLSYLLNKSRFAFLGCSWILWQHVINIWLLLFLFNFYLECLCCFKPNIYSIAQPPAIPFLTSTVISPAWRHQPSGGFKNVGGKWSLMPHEIHSIWGWVTVFLGQQTALQATLVLGFSKDISRSLCSFVYSTSSWLSTRLGPALGEVPPNPKGHPVLFIMELTWGVLFSLLTLRL